MFDDINVLLSSVVCFSVACDSGGDVSSNKQIKDSFTTSERTPIDTSNKGGWRPEDTNLNNSVLPYDTDRCDIDVRIGLSIEEVGYIHTSGYHENPGLIT